MAPQNYVQQLASALGLNNTNASSNNGTTTNNNSIASSTDFESLIEMNRRQQLSVSKAPHDIVYGWDVCAAPKSFGW